MVPTINLANRLLLASPPPCKHKTQAELTKYAFNVDCPEHVRLKHFKLLLKATGTVFTIILAPSLWLPILCTTQRLVLHGCSWIAINCCSEILWRKGFHFCHFIVHLRLPFSGIEQESFELCWLIVRDLQSLGRLRDEKASSLVWHHVFFCLFRATAVCKACIMRSLLFRMLYSPSWTRQSYAFSVYWIEYVE